MPLHLCVGHMEQYYANDLKGNSFLLAWMLDHQIVIKTNDIIEVCDWCKLGMPTFN